jgi:hypothetical protein
MEDIIMSIRFKRGFNWINTTVRGLLRCDICVDVYETIADDIAVAFEGDGGNPLTKKGEEHFKDILDFPVIITDGYAHVDTASYYKEKGINIDGYDFETRETTPPEVVLLIDLFWGLAGYDNPENMYFKFNESDEF